MTYMYCRRKELKECVRKPREKLCASAFHLSKIRKKGHQKWTASPPTLRVGFLSFGGFWRRGTCSRIVFLEVFARWPLTLADDNRAFITGREITVLYQKIHQKNSKNPKMGVRRARSARRTTIFGGFLNVCLVIFFRYFSVVLIFFIQYCS